MARHSPDDPFDRLLSRSLRDGAAAGGDVCPDADTLAAYVDGTLSARESTHLEGHASSCARCASILAVTVTSDPGPAQTAPAGIWSVWRAWRWAVPTATAVLVFGVWFASSRPEIVREDRTAPAATTLAEAPRAEAEIDAVTRPPAPEPVPAAPPVADARVVQEPAPTAAAREAVAPPSERARFSAATDAVADGPAAVAGAAPSTPPPGVAPVPAQAAGQAIDQAAPQAEAARSAAPALLLTTAAPATPAVVPGPDASILWRVSGTIIERTTDGGAQWTIDYTAERVVTGGAAVSSDVAWFYGPGRFLLRRTAAGWSTVDAPAEGEIVSIAAESDAVATVSLADGRRLRTVDGGTTWQAL